MAAEPPLSDVIPLGQLTPSIAAHLRSMMRARRYQRSTILRRYRELVALERIVGAPLDQVSRDRLEDWWGDLPMAWSTCKAKLAHARMYFRWCVRTERIDRDPCLGIESPKAKRGTPRPLDPDVVLALLDRLDGRAHWAVGLMLHCGLRCKEAVAVCPAKDITAGPEGPELTVTNKGGDARRVAIPADLAARLRAGAPTGYAFASTRSATGHWTPAYMSRYVAQALRDGGIPGKPTAHQLRHTYITWVYRGTGGDAVATMRAAGHRSLTAMQVYADAAPIPRQLADHLYSGRRQRGGQHR